MFAKVSSQAHPFQRRRGPSPYVRLAQELGYAKAKTARDNLAKPYRQVAITNRVLHTFGLDTKACELMAEVDASMAGACPPLPDAIHEHNLRDASEDVAQAEFIHNAGDAELLAWINKLAADIRSGERLLAGLEAEHAKREAARKDAQKDTV